MVETGVNLGLGRGLTLTPRAALAYSSYQLGGFEERGGETALQMDDLRLQRLETRLGARLAGTMRMGSWALQPQIQADYVHTLSGANDGMSVRFADVARLRLRPALRQWRHELGRGARRADADQRPRLLRRRRRDQHRPSGRARRPGAWRTSPSASEPAPFGGRNPRPASGRGSSFVGGPAARRGGPRVASRAAGGSPPRPR